MTQSKDIKDLKCTIDEVMEGQVVLSAIKEASDSVGREIQQVQKYGITMSNQIINEKLNLSIDFFMRHQNLLING